jgi:hypothetical protein
MWFPKCHIRTLILSSLEAGSAEYFWRYAASENR